MRLMGVVPGLNDYVGNHPPVAPVFFAFRIMVGIGLLMLAVSWAARSSVAPRDLPRWLPRAGWSP
jgi:cytochrome d ubiquinol oxidase subunit I